MDEILQFLEDELKYRFQEDLRGKNKKIFMESNQNLLITYGCIEKTEKNFRDLIESSSLPRPILENKFSKDIVKRAFENNYIKNCQTIPKYSHIHITANGLYYLFNKKGMQLEDFFIQFDNYRLPSLRFKLKPQEKLFSLFLIILSAISKKDAFILKDKDHEFLNKCFILLKKIDSKLKSYKLELYKDINWGKGKNINFRKFITNNTDLPKTGIYHYSSVSDEYYLDLKDNRKNIEFLLDLIIDAKDSERITAKSKLFDLIWDFNIDVHQSLNIISPQIDPLLMDVLRN